MVARLEAAIRIGPTNDQFDYVWDTGGAATAGTITLTHGLYATPAALWGHILGLTTAVHADWTFSQSSLSDTYFFDGGAGGELFDITWTRPALRDWLGWSANLSGANTYTSGAAPGIFLATVPWQTSAPAKRWYRKSKVWQHQGGGSLVLGSLRKWDVTARCTFDELPQLESVLSYLMRGGSGRWYQNTLDGTAWSFANFDGRNDIVLETADITPGWMGGGNTLTHVEYRLRFVEYGS